MTMLIWDPIGSVFFLFMPAEWKREIKFLFRKNIRDERWEKDGGYNNEKDNRNEWDFFVTHIVRTSLKEPLKKNILKRYLSRNVIKNVYSSANNYMVLVHKSSSTRVDTINIE